MSQVKFILLGTLDAPKQHYGDSPTEYERLVKSTIANNPGAIIFTTFVKSEGGKPKNEIYANGQVYSVGGGGSGSVYYGTDLVENGAISNWSTFHPGEEPERGSIYIYTPNSETTGKDIANRTAYYFECTEGLESLGKWIAFTGNVNAENVWFPNGIDRTEAFGWKVEQEDVANECANLNLKDALEFYLVKAKFPTVTSTYLNTVVPTWGITSGTLPTLNVYTDSEYKNSATSGTVVEVGTKFYINDLSYDTTVTCKHATEASNLSTEDTKTFNIGPSKITGLTYGFWTSDGFSSGAKEADRFNITEVTFNGLPITNANNVTYTPHSTSKTATITYKYTNTGNSFIQLSNSGFSSDNTVTTSQTTGDGTLTLTKRALTTNGGNNSITLKVQNANYWSRSFTNNSIPESDTIYAASNKYNSYDYTAKEKAIKVSSSTVGSNEDKKVSNGGLVTLESFSVTGVYKVYITGIALEISIVNSSNVVGTEFTKPNDAGNTWSIAVPSSMASNLTLLVYAAGLWGNHANTIKSTETKLDASGADVNYIVFTPSASDGKDTKYKLVKTS